MNKACLISALLAMSCSAPPWPKNCSQPHSRWVPLGGLGIGTLYENEGYVGGSAEAELILLVLYQGKRLRIHRDALVPACQHAGTAATKYQPLRYRTCALQRNQPRLSGDPSGCAKPRT